MAEFKNEASAVVKARLEELTETGFNHNGCLAKTAWQLYMGEKVAVLCARYQYRGYLVYADSECIVLDKAVCVEISGSSKEPEAQVEDDMCGPVTIAVGSIELLHTPNWVNAPLEGELGYKSSYHNSTRYDR